MNLDLLSGLSPEEVCERSEDGTCDKCGAREDQGCQLQPLPSMSPALAETWGAWADAIVEQIGDE